MVPLGTGPADRAAFPGAREVAERDVDLPKINAELFAKIRLDQDGPEFDDAEAGMVIGRVERCPVAMSSAKASTTGSK